MKNLSEYRYIINELFDGTRENSRHNIRARPLPNQWANPSVRVEFTSRLRTKQNIGQLYKINAKFKNTNLAPQLYTHSNWKPVRVSMEEAQNFIAGKDWWLG